MSEMAPIQSLWIGGALSPMEQLVAVSWMKNGHEFHLYTYGEVENVPEGVIIKDANEIVPSSAKFKVGGGWALFSDYFRFELLYKLGGWWVDMDLVALKPLNMQDDVVLAAEDGAYLAIGLMRFPAGHPLVKRMLKRAEDPPHKYLQPNSYDSSVACKIGPGYRRLYNWSVRRNYHTRSARVKRFSEISVWGSILGPTALTEEYNDSQTGALILEPEQIYPVSYSNWKDIFQNKTFDNDPLENALTIHLWNDMMRRDVTFDKNAPAVPGSIYFRLKERYGVI